MATKFVQQNLCSKIVELTNILSLVLIARSICDENEKLAFKFHQLEGRRKIQLGNVINMTYNENRNATKFNHVSYSENLVRIKNPEEFLCRWSLYSL